MEIIAHCPHRVGDVRAWLHEALRSPAQRIELDVVHRDGMPVVGHDARSARHRAMPLADALAAIARADRAALLDVKDPLAPIAAALVAAGLAERAMICGAAERLDGLPAGTRRALTLPAPGIAPAGPVGLATRRARARVRDAALAAQVDAVCVDRRFVAPGLGGELGARGIELIVWTVDTPRQLARARRAEASAIVTNHPAIMSAG